MTPETDDKRYVKKGRKTGKEKENCSDSASLRQADRILARTGRDSIHTCISVPRGIRTQRNEMNRNDKRCSFLSSRGRIRKLAKIALRLTRP